MSSIATLNAQLQEYEALSFHHHTALAECLKQVEQWQHQRIQHIHSTLWTPAKNARMSQFFLSHLYNLESFERLANQLRKAAREKVKLERFVPENVMHTAEMGLQLGILSLRLDEQLAFFCFERQLPINDENMLLAFLEYQKFQFPLRQQQLALLMKLGAALHQFSRSFLIQAGLSLAKGTATRRGYDTLFDFLHEGLTAMRSMPSNVQFFQTFIEGELKFITHIHQYERFPDHINF